MRDNVPSLEELINDLKGNNQRNKAVEPSKDISSKISEKRESYKENASIISKELTSLAYDYKSNNSRSLGYHYSEFWKHAKRIITLFKGSRLTREDREQLWSEYQSICQTVKTAQGRKSAESDNHKKILEQMITSAYHQAKESHTREDLDEAKRLHKEALISMKEYTLFKSDREEVWNLWLSTKETINLQRGEIQNNNYQISLSVATKCLNSSHYGPNPYDALKEIKKAQSSLRGVYMDRDQRKEIYDLLNDAWDKASSRIGELKREKQQKYYDWRNRMESHITRWERNIEKAESAISSIKSAISNLDDEESGAKSEDYASMVRGWRDDHYQKIEEIQNSIIELEGKITSAKDKLNK